MEHFAFRHAARDIHQHYSEQRDAQRKVLKEQLKALHGAQETIEKLEKHLIDTEEALAAANTRIANLEKQCDALQAQVSKAVTKKSSKKSGPAVFRIESSGQLMPGTVAPGARLNIGPVTDKPF